MKLNKMSSPLEINVSLIVNVFKNSSKIFWELSTLFKITSWYLFKFFSSNFWEKKSTLYKIKNQINNLTDTANKTNGYNVQPRYKIHLEQLYYTSPVVFKYSF